MIEARMTDLNYNEILIYLGHRGQEITPEIETQIQRCIAEIRRHAAPRLVYRFLPVDKGSITGFPLEGNDIRQLLQDCDEAVLFAVTLGSDIEQALMRHEVTDMADALILDACASVAVENVCDCFEEDVRVQLSRENRYLTSRFSPGYGDLPLETQTGMCGILNTHRRIGLTVTENYILVPRKSVTTVMGISDKPQKLRKRGCEDCNMFLNCLYRKKGIVCHE
ncbi:MAG: methionine synthase [Lachnospiraceae bacterium]|nr:methionine synthase [Lachnospiraceae bacterium]